MLTARKPKAIRKNGVQILDLRKISNKIELLFQEKHIMAFSGLIGFSDPFSSSRHTFPLSKKSKKKIGVIQGPIEHRFGR